MALQLNINLEASPGVEYVFKVSTSMSLSKPWSLAAPRTCPQFTCLSSGSSLQPSCRTGWPAPWWGSSIYQLSWSVEQKGAMLSVPLSRRRRPVSVSSWAWQSSSTASGAQGDDTKSDQSSTIPSGSPAGKSRGQNPPSAVSRGKQTPSCWSSLDTLFISSFYNIQLHAVLRLAILATFVYLISICIKFPSQFPYLHLVSLIEKAKPRRREDFCSIWPLSTGISLLLLMFTLQSICIFSSSF